MEQLKDIKPIVAIPDYSLWYLIIAIIIVLFISFLIVRMLWLSKRGRKPKIDEQKIALEILKKLDFQDSKTTTYRFERYGEVLLNADNAAQFAQIKTALAQYKYKKHVGDLDSELVQQMKQFIHA